MPLAIDPPNVASNENPPHTPTCSDKWALQRVYHHGADEIYELPENSQNLICRSRDAYINTRSLFCSRNHCTIRVNGDTLVVLDHSSTGTFGNDIQIERNRPQQLNNADIIDLGGPTKDLDPDEPNNYYFFRNNSIQTDRSEPCPIDQLTLPPAKRNLEEGHN